MSLWILPDYSCIFPNLRAIIFFCSSFETLNKIHISNNSIYEFVPESFYFLNQKLLALFGSNFPVLPTLSVIIRCSVLGIFCLI